LITKCAILESFLDTNFSEHLQLNKSYKFDNFCFKLFSEFVEYLRTNPLVVVSSFFMLQLESTTSSIHDCNHDKASNISCEKGFKDHDTIEDKCNSIKIFRSPKLIRTMVFFMVLFSILMNAFQFSTYLPYKLSLAHTRSLTLSNDCLKETIDSGRSYDSQTKTVIENCNFVRFSLYNSHGGVIFLNVNTSLTIFETMFTRCRVANEYWGGAVFAFVTNCTIEKVCATLCNAYEAKFAYIRVHNVLNNVFTSISNCSEKLTECYPLHISGGHQTLYDTNISNNHALQASGVGVFFTLGFESLRCTLSKNSAATFICIFVSAGIGNFSYMNYINNSNPGRFGGVYGDDAADFTFEHCIFTNNSNILFGTEDKAIHRVRFCYIHHTGTILGTGVYTQNVTLAYHSKFENTYFNTYYCLAEVTFTPKSTLMPTFEETLLLSQTFNPTPFITPVITLQETPEMTVCRTNELSPEITINPTVDQTIKPSPEISPEMTKIPTPKPMVIESNKPTEQGKSIIEYLKRKPSMAIMVLGISFIALISITIIACRSSAESSEELQSDFIHDSLI